ncbi:TerB family tellurite resistance protein [Flavobacteriaceae bacterium F08102]|nr:TerB family tellurite resistance protein [Flavobacteriaceae bacterium F08102]
MGNFTKWIGATLGWSFGGPIGGILGFIFGSIFDGLSDQVPASKQIPKYSGARGGKADKSQTTPGDFEVSLLVLAAVVIKSDGKVNKSELEFVRRNFSEMYGRERANKAFKLFNGIMEKGNIPTRKVCVQIREHMTHAARLQLVHFLFGISKADGVVSQKEIDTIKRISVYLYISNRDFDSIKAMFYKKTAYNPYVILEITKSASEAEVKKAYRTMAKKHHPDKIRHLGEEHIKGAEEKFQAIQKAYETIKAERGF